MTNGLIKVGRIVGPHGIRGLVKVEPMTDFPERMGKGARVSIKGQWYEVEEYRIHKERPILKLSGIPDRNAAETLRGSHLEMVLAERPALEEDEYLVEDLVGLRVITTAGRDLGEVEEVLPYPAQDILVVGEVLIPLVKAFVKGVDIVKGEIRVELVQGMLPGEEAE